MRVGLAVVLAFLVQTLAGQAPPHTAEHHEFTIGNFRTESGVTLPQAKVVYRKRTAG